MSRMLQFPTQIPEVSGESGHPIDAILRTPIRHVVYQGKLAILADGAKQIRDLFRSLGWARYFRITKGCWSLGPQIEWVEKFKPSWKCERMRLLDDERNRAPYYIAPSGCGCATCTLRRAQRDAVRRRVAFVLNAAFHKDGERTVGDHSDSMTDYFDADYTFHP